MDRRLLLQRLLEGLIVGIGKKVYFQPPSNVTLEYPCIVYSRDQLDTDHANNNPYRQVKRYSVKVIDRNPDSRLIELVASLPQCSFSRHYTAENLNHDVFNLYF